MAPSGYGHPRDREEGSTGMDGCFGYALIWFLVALVVIIWIPIGILMFSIAGLVIMAALFL